MWQAVIGKQMRRFDYQRKITMGIIRRRTIIKAFPMPHNFLSQLSLFTLVMSGQFHIRWQSSHLFGI